MKAELVTIAAPEHEIAERLERGDTVVIDVGYTNVLLSTPYSMHAAKVVEACVARDKDGNKIICLMLKKGEVANATNEEAG
jgi:hypothetical protein